MAYAIAAQCESSEGLMRLLVTGEVDLETVPALEAEFDQARTARLDVIVDLSNVEFMDARGVRLLLAAASEAAAAGLTLEIAPDIPRDVRRLFELTAFPLTG